MRRNALIKEGVMMLLMLYAQLCAAQIDDSDIQAALQGDSEAQYRMGYSFERGRGVDQNDSKAFLWYKKSADQGHKRAQVALAKMFVQGRGTEQDFRQAYLYYKKAADQGMASAMYEVGICYEFGQGVAKDLKQASEWCKRAVNEGSKDAKKHIGTINEKYFLQCKESSDRGQIYALRDLGLCYEEGIGTAMNLKLAKEWYGKAVENNLLNANDDFERVEAKLEALKPKPINVATPVIAPLPPPKPVTPLLKITSFELDGDGVTLQKMQPFNLVLNLENVEKAAAEDVSVEIVVPDGVQVEVGEEVRSFPIIKGNETKALTYTIFIRNKYLQPKVPIQLKIKEKEGKYAEDWSEELTLGQNLRSISDINKDIPVTDVHQDNTYVLIIAEEHYRRVETVPFAISDGKLFREYCIKTLGVPEDHIMCESDMTKSEITEMLNTFRLIADRDKGENKLLFYYSGHGIPDEMHHTAHLLPIDGFANNTETCISLQELYQELQEIAVDINAKRVSVFLDACFSGLNREGGKVEKNRGVAIKVNGEEPLNNMVVFSASKADQAAYSYQDQQHGMFTYFLLKKLKDTQGNATYGEIADYLATEVRKTSMRVNQKIQSPQAISFTPGWEQWKLK